MSIHLDYEFTHGQNFVYIDREDDPAKPKAREVILKIDVDASVLIWEWPKKRRKKIIHECRFIYAESIADLRVERANHQEMSVICNRDYVSLEVITFIGDQHVVQRWTQTVFRWAFAARNRANSPLSLLNTLYSPIRLNANKEHNVKCVFEHTVCSYGSMAKKLLRPDKGKLKNPEEPLLDTYLRLAPRPDVEEIYTEISNGRPTISAETFATFINTTQLNDKHTPISLTQAERLISHLEQSAAQSNRDLSRTGFFRFLLGPLNDSASTTTGHSERTPLDRPISSYYIKSSHNTYLNGTQILAVKSLPSVKHDKCSSDAEMYRQILLGGTRCVELDVWDGPNGKPVVTHGPIALQQINTVPLAEVCVAILESAFKTSEYPVILSLENHCSATQQQVMVQYFTEIFGNYLLGRPLDEYPLEDRRPLPPPEALRYKILLKGTRHIKDPNAAKSDASKCLVDTRFLKYVERFKTDCQQRRADFRERRRQFGDQRNGANDYNNNNDPSCPPPQIAYTRNGRGAERLFGKLGALLNGGSGNNSLNVSPQTSMSTSQSTDDEFDTESLATVEMTTALADLVNYFQSTRIMTPDDPYYLMHSGNEAKIDKLIAANANKFIEHSANHIIRVYPGAWRVDSSNFQPMQYLMAGAQMVSLNFQTKGLAMQLYDSFFEDADSHSPGLVLKPDILTNPESFENPASSKLRAYRLEVEFLSAQFVSLLLERCHGKAPNKITLKLDFYDLPHNTQLGKWEMVSTRNEGFTSLFERKVIRFEKIIAPELSMLHVRVVDDRGAKVGQRFLRVGALSPGYRHFRLRNRANRTEPATVFAKFTLNSYTPDDQEELRRIYADPLRGRGENAGSSGGPLDGRLRFWGGGDRQKKTSTSARTETLTMGTASMNGETVSNSNSFSAATHTNASIGSGSVSVTASRDDAESGTTASTATSKTSSQDSGTENKEKDADGK